MKLTSTMLMEWSQTLNAQADKLSENWTDDLGSQCAGALREIAAAVEKLSQSADVHQEELLNCQVRCEHILAGDLLGDPSGDLPEDSADPPEEYVYKRGRR